MADKGAWTTRYHRKDLSIVLFGRMGAGKLSLINTLFMDYVAPEGDNSTMR